MPTNTEQSFADRLSRARLMQTRIASFAPLFAPVDPNISPAAFESYCNGCEAANTAVSDAQRIRRHRDPQRRLVSAQQRAKKDKRSEQAAEKSH